MKITFLGQAAFKLETSSGVVIVCDPYHPMVGYPGKTVRADIVTISHEHADHNHMGWVEGKPEVLRGVGSRTVNGVTVTGLESFHDAKRGAERGPNTVFLIEADGVRVCHLGDIGHEPDAALYAAIGKPDVLLIPVGGFYTFEPDIAVKTAKAIGARLTIPMHFNSGVRDTPVATVEPFAKATGAERLDACTIEAAADMPGPRTVVLDYAR